VFRVVAYGAEPPATVTVEVAGLPQRADPAALEAGAEGWYHDPTGAGTLYVKVLGASRTVEVTR
jgi:hypothetical protein